LPGAPRDGRVETEGRTPPATAMDRRERLQATYAAFNARDIDAVLAQMTADVDWPNAWEGGRVQGP
jgi:hypothetical protein